MFKNIQNRLLLTNPMLWNLKIVPFTILVLAIHVIFFAVGYVNGAIDFTETDSNYRSGFNKEIVILIGGLITILIFIVWLVVYSRNNGFKSFYPKKDNSLFKEWLLILLFCILNVSYIVSYVYASDLRARNYFTEQEINKRCEVIAMSSLFLEGSFQEEDYIMVLNEKTQDTTDMVAVARDSFEYDKKNYSIRSLINKDIDNFSIFYNQEEDSLNETRVKRWLTEDKKDSVQWLFKEYFGILNEHHLKSNITPEKWLELMYDPPSYTNYANIGKIERERRYDYDYGYYEGVETQDAAVEIMEDSSTVASLDSISKTIKIVNGSEYIYSKYYVSHNALLRSYGKISKSWEDPDVNAEMLMGFIYFAIALSLLVFSFKVTSGRNWLIALVSLGIVGIIAGVISILVRYNLALPISCITIFIGLLVYFIMICRSKDSKGISGITLSQLLWMLPAIMPIIYFVGLDIAKDVSGYDNRFTQIRQNNQQIEAFPRIEWLVDHSVHFMGFNILIVILLMYIFSIQIKKWKGIAEA